MRRPCLVAAFLLGSIALSAADLPNGKKLDVTFEQMANTYLFNFGGVGFAGATSEGELGYYEILSHPNAAAEFENLFTRGNLQAKCYALVALQKLSPKRFETLASTLESSRVRVHTAHGCVIFDQPLSAVIKAIRSGAYVTRASTPAQH